MGVYCGIYDEVVKVKHKKRYFDDIDNCPLEDAYISTVAFMRQPFNAWLWLYLINEDGVTIASICGHDDLDGFSKYVANLRKAYQ